MKKFLSLSIMALALIAFASSSAFACGTCGCSSDAKKTSAEKKSCSSKTDAEKAACSSKDKKTTATKISAPGSDSKSCDAKTNATKASAPGSDSKSCGAKTNATKASAPGSDSKTCDSKTNATKASASYTCSEADLKACAEKMGLSAEECEKMCGEKGTMTMHKISIEGMTCGSCEASVTKAIEAVTGVQKVISISHKDANALVCVDKSKTCLTTLTKTIVDKGYKAEIISAVATTSSSDKAACSKTCTSAEKAACDSKSKDAEKKPEDTK